MRYGTIVQYFPDKGFGFIRPDAGPDVFFHITAFGACQEEPAIQLGQAVKYELMPKSEATASGRDRGDAQGKSGQRRAKLVELIERIPGASLDDTPQKGQNRHPRSRKKKPSWRR